MLKAFVTGREDGALKELVPQVGPGQALISTQVQIVQSPVDIVQQCLGSLAECRWGPWNLCAIALIALSIYNLLLTGKLMYGSDCSTGVKLKQDAPRVIPVQTGCNSLQMDIVREVRAAKFDINVGRWDNRQLYKLYDRVFLGDKFVELSKHYVTCLATQSSLERLYPLVQVVNHWNASISVALFAAGDDELNLLLSYIVYLRRCYPKIRDRVAFHIALPKYRMPEVIDIEAYSLSDMNCLKPDAVLEDILRKRTAETSKWRVKHPYPQNHLRNLARKNCQTPFVFLTDVDIIPSQNLAEGLNKFLEKVTCEGACAYVIPTYEIDNRVHFPANKTELIRLADKGLARPFHQKVFIYNQYATNFSKWQDTHTESKDVHVSHRVTNFEFLYEPFYVAADNAPPHDERFLGYGYTRNTQVYEMFVAGYNFMVLSPVFTCHWGLQIKRGRPHWREHQNNMNRKQFDIFKREVFARYNNDPLKMMERHKSKK